VAKETKMRIKQLAHDLQFEFNSNARSLSTKKTGIIAVIFPAFLDSFDISLYTSSMFVDLRLGLEKNNLDTFFLDHFNSETGESNIRRLIRQKKVDGFIFLHSEIPVTEWKFAQENSVPVVQLHLPSRFRGYENIDYFLPDNQKGARAAASFLIKKGCKKVITLSGTPDWCGEFENRTKGFLAVAGRDEKASALVYKIPCSFIGGYMFIKNNLSLIKTINGIFIQADVMAFGVLFALSEAGIRVPEDIQIIGYDDIPLADEMVPPLTTIHQPREKMTVAACRRIKELLSNSGDSTPVQELFEPTLVKRGTTL